MRRPLFLICLLLVAVTLLRGNLFSSGVSPGESGLPLSEGQQITITGQIDQKDTKYYYFTSNSISTYQDAAVSQQESTLEHYDLEHYDLEHYRFLVEWAEEPESLAVGSIVCLRGTFQAFSRASNPGEFDSQGYYRTLGIAGKLKKAEVLECREPSWREGKLRYEVMERLYGLKQYFLNRLQQVFPEKEASIMSTMLLGERSQLDPEIKELYQSNGIIHILSISGLHITIIGMGIYRLLRKLELPGWLAAVGGGILLLGYGIMTGMGISACRAIGMYFIRMLGIILGRTYDMLTALGVLAVFLTWNNPLLLTHAGFLLSFGSILGIGVVYPIWKEGVKGKLWETLMASASITLMTLPIQLWFYYEIPVYSMVLNLLVLPFMELVVLAGLGALLVPGLGILGTVDCVILQGYELLCIGFEQLPFHTWNPGRPQWWQMLVYYGLLGLACIGRKKIRLAAAGLLVGLGVCSLAIPTRLGNRVTFLDVGQGDGICLQTGSEVYLFDGGSSSRSKLGEYVLLPYLKYCGIRSIDALFLSHPDTDHCNGAVELLQLGREEHLEIGRVVLPDGDWAKEDWQEILSAMGSYYYGVEAKAEGETEKGEEELADREMGEKKDVDTGTLESLHKKLMADGKLVYVHAGQRIQGEKVTMICLHPPAQYDTEDGNGASQCFYVEFPGCEGSLLLTGDVQGEGEMLLQQELTEWQEKEQMEEITVLKVAHHGSKNSTPQELLTQLQPGLAVISCGASNRYGHPHEELLERLEQAAVPYYTTPDTGAITIYFDGKGVKAETFF